MPFQGCDYKVVIQVRVDPSKHAVVKADQRNNGGDGEYWLATDGSAVRPYAVCLYKV